MARSRGSFPLVVCAGVAAAGIAAFAGQQPWAHGAAPGALGELTATIEAGKVPAANALSLVVLACWGVLLVTRGVVRRLVSLIAVLASAGLIAVVVTGYSSAPDNVHEAYRDLGVADPGVSTSGWFWIAAVSSVLTLLTTGAALRLVPKWPEMGRKYDAPASGDAGASGASDASGRVAGGGPKAEGEPAHRENLDLWRAIDQGHDPTA